MDADGAHLGDVSHLVGGEWRAPGDAGERAGSVPDPLTGAEMMRVPDPVPDVSGAGSALGRAVANLRAVPKSGVHNPLKHPERYLMYGRVCAQVAERLRDPEVESFFASLIQRVSPKSRAQAVGEVVITRQFFENFGGDQVRFLARSFGVPGDHYGQMSNGYRFPFGGVAIITPFNFPLEIPALQLLGALFMGNRPLLKVDSKVSIVMEQFLRMMIECGMPARDVDLVHCGGDAMHAVLMAARPRNTLFTGSSRVAEMLARDLRGKIKVEDAGFDWKILGPDVPAAAGDVDYVAYVCDQDAYACTGQKCSAQSMLFVHDNWMEGTDLLERMRARAARRSLGDLTVGPTLSVTTAAVRAHVDALLRVEGARLLFGGRELEGHTIPPQYGAFEPTAVFVPLEAMVRDAGVFALATTEVFAPVQVVTRYGDASVDDVLGMLERMGAHADARRRRRGASLEFPDRLTGPSASTRPQVRTSQQPWFPTTPTLRGGCSPTPSTAPRTWARGRGPPARRRTTGAPVRTRTRGGGAGAHRSKSLTD